jgi:heterodisulfide reductase subunit C
MEKVRHLYDTIKSLFSSDKGGSVKPLVTSRDLNSRFLDSVERKSGEDIRACYQCGKCTAGCPMVFSMDYSPNQIMRLIQLGLKEEVLSSATIWLCASCTIRCPRDIDLARVMNTLRLLARYCKEPVKIKYEVMDVPLFNEIFLKSIYKFGRLNDMYLVRNFNLKSGNYFKDMFMGPVMFLKGKLKLRATKVKNIKEIKKIFAKVKELEEG